jgi:tetratricopeptide (TPR) repeat protein
MEDVAAPKRVFCCHRSTDKTAVEAFARRLRECGIDAWFQEWEMAPGDDEVARLNEGLATCDTGLVFFSKATASGAWVSSEISALIYDMVEKGHPVIPVMLEDDVELPPLLRTRARRGIKEFEAIVDAILGRSARPPLGPAPAPTHQHAITVRLARPAPERLAVELLLDGVVVASEPGVSLPGRLQTSYAQFLQGELRTPTRSPAGAALASLESALERLGTELGAILFPGQAGEFVAARLEQIVPGEVSELAIETGDDMLLALPWEAARLGNRVPALHPAVRMLRRPVDMPLRERAPLAGPLKVLVAVGAPDEGELRDTSLDYEREIGNILDAIEPHTRRGNVQVKFLEVGHPSEIARALADDQYHVLHLSGHGQAGVIELEDEEGNCVPTTAVQLADAILSSSRPLPLIFLSSCHGGAGTSETVSLALGLLARGIPMVLSMQSRVTDRYASELAAAFYEGLCRGERPLASRALAEARRTLEERRIHARQRGAAPEFIQPEYATASLFCAGPEVPVLDYGLQLVPLHSPPIHRMEGPVPQLGIGDLVGRRDVLRRVLRILRREPRGVALTGMGGVGKSALAGRVMTRLREAGWIVAAVSGPFSLHDTTFSLAAALRAHAPSAARTAIADRFSDATNGDDERLALVCNLLQTERVLLVLDNFEDNLTTAGEFTNEVTAACVQTLLRAIGTGKLLVTSRYPVPESRARVDDVPLGPLTMAQTRRFLLRLPALATESGATFALVLRRIGGHPRMLEYLDGILRGGDARLPDVAERLQKQADERGIELTAESLDPAIEKALLLGTCDILLDELLTIAEQSGDLEVFHQAAVSSLPITVTGLAHALHGSVPSPAQVTAVRAATRRLARTSLLTPMAEDSVWVHRWTVEAWEQLRKGDEDWQALHRQHCERAGAYRAWRVNHESHDLDDLIEATRNFLEARAFDQVGECAKGVVDAMHAAQQTISVAVFCTEVLSTLPNDNPAYWWLLAHEANANRALGLTNRALARHHEAHAYFKARAEAEPHRSDLQREFSASLNNLGDLMLTLGNISEARTLLEEDLNIARRLAQEEPDRSDFQRDLGNFLNRLANVMRLLGNFPEAQKFFQEALDIARSLAQAEPYRGDFQLDLSISLSALGHVLQDLGHRSDAQALLREALDVAHRLAEAEPERSDVQRNLADCFNTFGDLMRDLAKPEAAGAFFEQSLEIRQCLSQAEPHRSDLLRDLCVSLSKVGDLVLGLGDHEEALDLYQQALDINDYLAEAEPHRSDYQADLSVSLCKVGDVLLNLGDTGKAAELFQRSLNIANYLTQAEPDSAHLQRERATTLDRLGRLMLHLGNIAEAQDFFQKSLDIARRLAQMEPARADRQVDLAIALVHIAQVVDRTKHLQEAQAILTTLHQRGLLPPRYVPNLKDLERRLA